MILDALAQQRKRTYRGHGVEKFELDFDPTENTLPSHAKATTHGKRAPG